MIERAIATAPGEKRQHINSTIRATSDDRPTLVEDRKGRLPAP